LVLRRRIGRPLRRKQPLGRGQATGAFGPIPAVAPSSPAGDRAEPGNRRKRRRRAL